MTRRLFWPVAVFPLFLLLAAGCGNLTAGGQTADVDVTVSGDAPDGTSNALRVPVGTTPGRTDDDDDDQPEGEIELEFTLAFVRPDGTEFLLSDDEVEVELDVEGTREVEVLRRAVPAERYTHLRITFTEIEVEVEAGLIVDGIPIVGAIDVELEGGDLVVERELDLILEEGARLGILIDLNAALWLRAVDPDLRRVADEFVRSAISVRTS